MTIHCTCWWVMKASSKSQFPSAHLVETEVMVEAFAWSLWQHLTKSDGASQVISGTTNRSKFACNQSNKRDIHKIKHSKEKFQITEYI